MPSNLKGFTNFSVICEFPSFFSLHVVDGLKIVFVECVRAMFMVLSNYRMVPVVVMDGACMFLPSEVEVSVGLSYVCGGVGA